jgi:hypothetical protein
MVVDSKKQQLKFDDIVKISVQETKSQYPAPVAMVGITKEITMPGVNTTRIGNTVFIVHTNKESPKHIFFRALNADTAKNYIENSKKFTEQMKKKGYTAMVTQFQDPTLLNIFKAIARDKPADMGYAVQKSKDGKTYQVSVQLSKGHK